MFPIFVVSEKIVKALSIFLDVYAIALFPFVISREELDEETKNHERIHFSQQLELLVLPFYILYAIFFLIGWIKYRDNTKAYLSIPFEIECYKNEEDLNYLSKRTAWAWIKYR